MRPPKFNRKRQEDERGKRKEEGDRENVVETQQQSRDHINEDTRQAEKEHHD
jgi:hypothetical protein